MPTSTDPPPSARYRFAILGAALLFSTGGAAIKACGLTAWQVAGFRSGIAAIAILVLIPAARSGWSKHTAVVGLAYAATMILFVLGNKLTTAANTIFLQSTAPLYVLMLSPWLLREKIKRSDVLLMLAIAAGFSLFFVNIEPSTASAPSPFLGNILSACAGVSWALTLLGLRWLESKTEGSGLGAVVLGNGFAFVICVPFAFPVADSTAIDFAVVTYLGVIQIGLAYLLLTYGFRRVPAFEASLLILLEPTLNPVWAWLVQGEVPGKLAIVGGMVILAASTAKGWLDQRVKPSAVP